MSNKNFHMSKQASMAWLHLASAMASNSASDAAIGILSSQLRKLQELINVRGMLKQQ